MTTETKTDLQLKTTRQFRRLRWQFKKDAGLQKLTAADRMLIDQCALLALRSRQMRDDVLSGEKVVDDDDIVRSANAAIRAMKVLAERGAQTKGPKRPYGLADIQAALAEGRDDEDDESMKPLDQTTIIEACKEPKLFAPAFRSGWFKKTDESWLPWFAFLKALFGLPMDEAELAIFKQCTGLDTPPDGGVFEAALICGRRSGKSRTMALIAAYLGTMVDWSPYLAKGERGTVVVVATDKKQARSIFNGVREFLKVKLLAPLIQRETLESLELSNGITIEILPASYRTIRGYTVVAALLDELAFWRTDEGSSNPDREIVNAVRPAMATVPASRLILASSPYGKKGELWDTYQRYYGKPGDVLVWKAPTKVMNPTIRQSVIDAAYRKDPEDASAEWGAEFRGDLSGWADRALIEAAVDHGMIVRPPIPGVPYVGFTDPSGGAKDSFTAAVAHAEGDTAVLDCLVEVKAPFNPDEAAAQIADVLKSYGVTTVTADRYAARWPVAAFGRHGIKLVHSERERSQIYLDALPLFTTGRARLLDNERLVAQFAGLVRTTSPSGRDKVDHGKTGADDVCNSAAGAMILATSASKKISWSAVAGDRTLTTDSAESHGYGGTWPRPVALHERPPERLWPTGDVRFG